MRRYRSDDSDHAEAGFTLIELMIALVLLSILLAMSFPAFTSLLNSGSQTASGSSAQTQSASVAQQLDADIRAISGAGNLGSVDSPTIDNLIKSLDDNAAENHGILRAGPRILQINADVAGASDDFETVTWELKINDGQCPGDAASNWCITRDVQGNALNIQEVVSAGGGLFPNSADCNGNTDMWMFCYRFAQVAPYSPAGWLPTSCTQSWGAGWNYGPNPNTAGANVSYNATTITKTHYTGGIFTMSPLDRITTIRTAAAAGAQTGGRIRNDMTSRETDIIKRNSTEYMTALMCGARMP